MIRSAQTTGLAKSFGKEVEMSSDEDMFGRIMAHAFSDELEKIALSRELLLRASKKATQEAKAIREATPPGEWYGAGNWRDIKGIFAQAAGRRADQAAKFHAHANRRGSAELLRDVKRNLGMPLVEGKTVKVPPKY